MVCEACEFVDTFLKLFPNISIVLNIDRDHLDYFKTMENLKLSFSKFCKKTTDMGHRERKRRQHDGSGERKRHGG